MIPVKRNRIQTMFGTVLSLILLLNAGLLSAQENGVSMKGTMEHIKVHSKSLEGNLEGNSSDRDAFVYLPPSYGTEKSEAIPWSMCCTVIP